MTAATFEVRAPLPVQPSRPKLDVPAVETVAERLERRARRAAPTDGRDQTTRAWPRDSLPELIIELL